MREENFKKLKQLDKIEFLLREKEIEERWLKDFSFTFTILKFILFFLGFVLTLYFFSVLMLYDEVAEQIISFIQVIRWGLTSALLLGVIFDFLFLIKLRKEKDKLAEEFFKVELKNEKERNQKNM